MAKLTVSVDDRVVSRAKRYAKLRGFSIRGAPILRSVRGVLKNGEIGEHREHLAAKYR